MANFTGGNGAKTGGLNLSVSSVNFWAHKTPFHVKTPCFPFFVRRLPALALATAGFLCATAVAQARLGDTFADIARHRGKPAGKPDKSKALWLFEGDDGQLAYAVKFDAQGRSIAETLKPGQLGHRLHSEFVLDFIKAQREVLEGSKTTRELATGEKYTFAGQSLAVAANEYVVIDEPRGFLLVWVRGSLPSVTVLAPAALQ